MTPHCLCEQCEMTVQQCKERGPTTSAEREMLFPNSTDMLLIAHDEWKRREERKRIHPETPWIHGWINGFLTSRKFVQERIAELRAKAERK